MRAWIRRGWGVGARLTFRCVRGNLRRGSGARADGECTKRQLCVACSQNLDKGADSPMAMKSFHTGGHSARVGVHGYGLRSAFTTRTRPAVAHRRDSQPGALEGARAGGARQAMLRGAERAGRAATQACIGRGAHHHHHQLQLLPSSTLAPPSPASTAVASAAAQVRAALQQRRRLTSGPPPGPEAKPPSPSSNGSGGGGGILYAKASAAAALLPGVGLAYGVMQGGFALADVITSASGVPLSGMPVAILLGAAVNNAPGGAAFALPAYVRPGLQFAGGTVLRVGIVCVGAKLSALEVMAAGAFAVPAVMASVGAGLVAGAYTPPLFSST